MKCFTNDAPEGEDTVHAMCKQLGSCRKIS